MSSFVWQQKGTPWCGVAIYHVTAVSPYRHPTSGAFGELRWALREGQVEDAWVEWSLLGARVWACIQQISVRYPSIRVVAARVMPDHVHVVMFVTEAMPVSFNRVLRGWVQGCRKEARALGQSDEVFSGKPFVRVLTGRDQLDTMAAYVRLNPYRLAVRRAYPDCFAIQRGVNMAGQVYAAVGNVGLLLEPHLWQVHVHKEWVWDAERHGFEEPLRRYKNECIVQARGGAVLVSPFINEHEAAVRDVALREHLSVIWILDNGFPEGSGYYKPFAEHIEAIAAGRLLLLSPWDTYTPDKERCTRAECLYLNTLASSLISSLSSS